MNEMSETGEVRVARLLAGRTIVMVGMMGAGKSSIVVSMIVFILDSSRGRDTKITSREGLRNREET